MSGLSLPLAFFDFLNAPAWVKPFWHIGWGGVLAFAALAVLFALLQTVLPKIAAIAWTTAKEAVLQPLFYILLGAGVFSCCSRCTCRTLLSARTPRWWKRTA